MNGQAHTFISMVVSTVQLGIRLVGSMAVLAK